MSESNDTGQDATSDALVAPWDADGNRCDNPDHIGQYVAVKGMRLTPLDAEGRPSGPSVPVEGAVHMHYTTLSAELDPTKPDAVYGLFGPPDSSVRRRAVEVGEAAGPMLAQAAASLAPVVATLAGRLRPLFELMGERFAEVTKAAQPVLEYLERLHDAGDGRVRLRDGRVVPLASIRPAPLSRAVRGKLRRHGGR